ncbi:MAG TPA: lipase family protein [Candidatus Elarobacter sp.]|jgi:hypothetical protein|nr:lipase family protein [Candidatus Elarobacter sp.]
MAISVVLPFTPLVEKSGSVTTSPPPAPFDPNVAYLLGQCCTLTYTQFDADSIDVEAFSSLIYAGYAVSASNLQGFTVSEADEPGPSTGDVGDYDTVTGGFAVQLTLTPTGGGATKQLAVIALRGSRTWDEWLGDNPDAIPTPYPDNQGTIDGLGSVHSGFYGLYTLGEDGAKAPAGGGPLSTTPTERAPQSLAQQVAQYVTKLDGSLPLYVTGHSLGGALAALCAVDVAHNFPTSFSTISAYTLAAPRVATGINIPGYDNENLFVSNFQRLIPNSYAIVHAADVVPILPPATLTYGGLTLTCMHVTDAYDIGGSGATAQATVAGGAVTSVTVTAGGSDYYFAPLVTFSGGGGSGATAVATVGGLIDHYVDSVTVNRGGAGYASAPNVAFVVTGSLQQNVVSFCAQSGDLGTNHSCTLTYVPYLAALAAGFS